MDGSSPARARAASTSSEVRFFDLRKARRWEIGEEETEGSWRTVDEGMRLVDDENRRDGKSHMISVDWFSKTQ